MSLYRLNTLMQQDNKKLLLYQVISVFADTVAGYEVIWRHLNEGWFTIIALRTIIIAAFRESAFIFRVDR